jgi:hypothetical protein
LPLGPGLARLGPGARAVALTSAAHVQACGSHLACAARGAAWAGRGSRGDCSARSSVAWPFPGSLLSMRSRTNRRDLGVSESCEPVSSRPMMRARSLPHASATAQTERPHPSQVRAAAVRSSRTVLSFATAPAQPAVFAAASCIHSPHHWSGACAYRRMAMITPIRIPSRIAAQVDMSTTMPQVSFTAWFRHARVRV